MAVKVGKRRSVSVIVTVRNEALTIAGLLATLATQTRLPDEVVVVDGGSTDGTVEELLAHGKGLPLRVVVAPDTNISAGRNRAVRESTHDLLAVTDGGCHPMPTWLENLLAPFEGDTGVDLVCGAFRLAPQTDFERCVGRCSGTDWLRVQGKMLQPSARSLAFKRSVWKAVGGFPEHVYAGEDLWFVLTLAERGYRVWVAHDAIVDWRPRSSYRAVIQQFHRYARDTVRVKLTGRVYSRTLVQYAMLAGLLLLGLTIPSSWPWLLLVGVGVAYLYRKGREGCFAISEWRTLYRVPLILASIHLGVVSGIARGLLIRIRERP